MPISQMRKVKFNYWPKMLKSDQMKEADQPEVINRIWNLTLNKGSAT